MNDLTIEEGNKLIAEFMDSYSEQTSDCQYHSSWDWLMPVVEKIGNIHYPDYWSGEKPSDIGEWDDTAFPYTFGMRDTYGNYLVRLNAMPLINAPTLIEATWKSVIEFIQWYNKEQKAQVSINQEK